MADETTAQNLDLAQRLEEASLPLMEEWLHDIQEMGSEELRRVPEDDLRVHGFLLVRKVIEFVAQQIGLQVSEGTLDLKELYLRGMSLVQDAIDDMTEYTRHHCRKVKEHVGRLAALLGLSDEEIADVEYAARIHNIGLINTISTSQNLLLAARRLTRNELNEIRLHCTTGADMMRPVQFLAPMVPMVLYHHARWDGTGYPVGVGGEDIPLGARLIALADAYQAMISPRPHRPAMSPDEAILEIKRNAGKQFDPEIAKVVDILRS